MTSFFRDPEVFDALERALGQLMTERSQDVPLRVWVPGCSTGEEAYSLGILAAEIAGGSRRALSVQIFASGSRCRSHRICQSGAYAEGIAADLGPARLERFFTRKRNRYHVKKEIREAIVFAVHNLIKDPPFTKLDVISCRNLLIYLTPELQKRLIPIFHYALNPGGLLLLGTSESTGSFDRLFRAVDHKCRLYERLPNGPDTVRLALPISRLPKTLTAATAPTEPVPPGVPESVASLSYSIPRICSRHRANGARAARRARRQSTDRVRK